MNSYTVNSYTINRIQLLASGPCGARPQLSAHGQVLVAIDHGGAIGLGDLAARVGLTVDDTFALIRDLVLARLVKRVQIDRLSYYAVNRQQARIQQLDCGRSVDSLLADQVHPQFADGRLTEMVAC